MKIFICPEWLQKMLCISLDSSFYLGLLFCGHVHDDTSYITTIFIMKNHKIACILKKLAEFLRLRSVWNQNRNSAGRYWHKHNIFDMNFKKVNVSLQTFENE